MYKHEVEVEIGLFIGYQDEMRWEAIEEIGSKYLEVL